MAKVVSGGAQVDGVRSPLRMAGPAAADEAMVFVHGNPGSSADWLDLLSHAGELGRAIAPDMPGYGEADRPRDFAYTVAGYAAHLGGLLDRLAVSRVHLVLHDFGGFWGLEWAAANPAKVASISLFNTGVMQGYKWHKFARIWQTPLLGELFQLSATRAGFRALLNADNPRPLPDPFVDAMYANYDRGMKRAVLRLYRATPNPGALADRWAAALAPLRLPSLVIWGAGDKYSPARYAPLQRSYFDAEVHVLPECGHWSMIDQPETARSLLVPFLRRQLQPAA